MDFAPAQELLGQTKVRPSVLELDGPLALLEFLRAFADDATFTTGDGGMLSTRLRARVPLTYKEQNIPLGRRLEILLDFEFVGRLYPGDGIWPLQGAPWP